MTSLVVRTPGVIFQFEIESCSFSVFPYHVRLWCHHVYYLWPYSGLNRPERKGRCLTLVPHAPIVYPQTRRKKNVEFDGFCKPWNVQEGSDGSSLLRRSWSTFPLSSGWTVDVVLRLAVRCNLVGGSQWMVAGRLFSVGTCPVECVVLQPIHWSKFVNRLSSASSTVSMTVLVVLSMLSLPCGVDDLRSCRRRVDLTWTLRDLAPLFRKCPHFFLEGVIKWRFRSYHSSSWFDSSPDSLRVWLKLVRS